MGLRIRFEADSFSTCEFYCPIFRVKEYALGYTYVGLETPTQPLPFTLAPNPSTHTVRLSHPQPADWQILDLHGRVVLHQAASPEWIAEVSPLSRGMYWVRCMVAGQWGVRKLVVE